MKKKRMQHKLVEKLLENYPKLRDDDWLLYQAVCGIVRPESLRMSFEEVCQKHSELRLPSFEGVVRDRRRVQEEKPWLKSSEYMEKLRLENEDLYHKYYSKLTEVRG